MILRCSYTITSAASEIRVWTLGGDAVYTLSGHTSFVYSLSVLPNGDIVSAGEDRTVRVWQGMHRVFVTRRDINRDRRICTRRRMYANHRTPGDLSMDRCLDAQRRHRERM